MVKKRNLITILIVVLVALGIMLLLTYTDEVKQIVVGLAGPLPMTSCMDDCSDGTSPGDCSYDVPFYCLGQAPTVEECGLVQDCSECGCWPPDYVCNSEKGTCSPPGGTPGDDDEEFCDSHWECTCNKVCENPLGELLNFEENPAGSCDELGTDCGECVWADEDDGHCAVESLEDYGFSLCIGQEWETCQDNVLVCQWQQADCPDGQICDVDPWNSEVGMCIPYSEGGCEDGTPIDSCSFATPGYYCELGDNSDPVLVQDCSGGDGIIDNGNDCVCGGEESYCVLIFNSDLGRNAGYCAGELENTNICGDGECWEGHEVCETCPEDCCPSVPINTGDDDPYSAASGGTDYCEKVGGVCAETCDADYYVLEDTDEYLDLHESCTDKNDDYVCCYPYANDELNDCEYYGGLCQEDCSGDYYHADVPYLDDECVFYSGEGNVCCLAYEDSSVEETGEEDATLWENLFGSPNAEEGDPNYDADDYIHLGETVSLHRNYVFVGAIVIIILAFVITAYYPKFKKK